MAYPKFPHLAANLKLLNSSHGCLPRIRSERIRQCCGRNGRMRVAWSAAHGFWAGDTSVKELKKSRRGIERTKKKKVVSVDAIAPARPQPPSPDGGIPPCTLPQAVRREDPSWLKVLKHMTVDGWLDVGLVSTVIQKMCKMQNNIKITAL